MMAIRLTHRRPCEEEFAETSLFTRHLRRSRLSLMSSLNSPRRLAARVVVLLCEAGRIQLRYTAKI